MFILKDIENQGSQKGVSTYGKVGKVKSEHNWCGAHRQSCGLFFK